MRALICSANTLFALALTLQSCGRTDTPRVPEPSAGPVAPEIVGDDLDGVPLRLSDYRGQVVLLDFWGDW
jgi:hypothetical protein